MDWPWIQIYLYIYTYIIYITSKRYSFGLAYPVARGIGAIGQLQHVVILQYPIYICASSAKTHEIAYTYCSVGISDLKPLTGTSADQLPHRLSRPLATA